MLETDITITSIFVKLTAKTNFPLSVKLQKDAYLTQQAEGTTLKTTSHSWMTSVASYIICLHSAPGKTSVSFMPIFVSFTNLNSSSHSNSLHKICIYTRQSIIQSSFTKNLHFPKINSEWLFNSYINLSQLYINHSVNIKCKQLKYFCEEQHHLTWLFSNCSIYLNISFV